METIPWTRKLGNRSPGGLAVFRGSALNDIPAAAFVRNSQFPAAFLAAAAQHVTAFGSLVARAETVRTIAFFVCGLPCPFHGCKVGPADRV